ncbi:hypothetical protein [Caulobacter sp.]|uniref:hypothetical protein n=1 Tax=Caulobacter sp. TaxID=78 RepID=UPI003BB1CC17
MRARVPIDWLGHARRIAQAAEGLPVSAERLVRAARTRTLDRHEAAFTANRASTLAQAVLDLVIAVEGSQETPLG